MSERRIGPFASTGLALLGLVLVLVVATWLGRRGVASSDGRTVLLVAIDDLRADRTSVHDPKLATTPVLGALAQRAAVYTDCVTNSTAVNPAVASLLSGLEPALHGVRSLHRIGAHRLPAAVETLAEDYSAHGYTTLAAVSSRQLAASLSGFGQGFGRYLDDDLPTTGRALAAQDVVQRVAERFEGELESAEPVFLFVHFGDLRHEAAAPAELLACLTERLAPFRSADPELDAAFAGLVDSDADKVAAIRARLARRRGTPAWDAYAEALYDAGLRTLDRSLGALFDVLRAHARFEGATIVVAGTRGAYVSEPRPHGVLEGLSEALVRTVLVARVPDHLEPGRWDRDTVSLRDVAATLRADLRVPGDDDVLEAVTRGVLESLVRGDIGYEDAPVDAPRIGEVARFAPDWKLLVTDGLGRVPDVFARDDARTAPIFPESYGFSMNAPAALAFELVAAPGDVALKFESLAEALILPIMTLPATAGGLQSTGVLTLAAGVPQEIESQLGPPALVLGLSSKDVAFVDADGHAVRALALARGPASPAWIAPAGEAVNDGEPRVDVMRAPGRRLVIRVTPRAPEEQGALARVFVHLHPPAAEPTALVAVAADGVRRLSATGLPDAGVFEGSLPFELTLEVPSARRLALAVDVAGEALPPTSFRYLGRHLWGDEARFLLPAFLPERGDWFVPELAGERSRAPLVPADTTIRLTRTGSAPVLEPPLRLTADDLDFLNRLGNTE